MAPVANSFNAMPGLIRLMNGRKTRKASISRDAASHADGRPARYLPISPNENAHINEAVIKYITENPICGSTGVSPSHVEFVLRPATGGRIS